MDDRDPNNKPGTEPITVFLLDDHEIVRRGVRSLLEVEDDIEVVGEAALAETATTLMALPR